MDTQQTKDTLVTLKTSIDNQIIGFTAQSEALAVAIQIIDGTLETQALELKAQYDSRIATLETEKANLLVQKETLEAGLTKAELNEEKVIEAQ
jgi:pectate lyase